MKLVGIAATTTDIYGVCDDGSFWIGSFDHTGCFGWQQLVTPAGQVQERDLQELDKPPVQRKEI